MTGLVVLDASLVASFLLREPAAAKFDELLANVARGKVRFHSPALFPFEMANILLTAERRRRITAAQRDDLLGELDEIPVVVDAPPSAAVRRRLLSLAAAHRLTAYDAAYLELAERLDARLVTLDTDLLRLKAAFDRIQ